jgi:hypothetical protein
MDAFVGAVRLCDVPGALRFCLVDAAVVAGSACLGGVQVWDCVSGYGFVELDYGAGVAAGAGAEGDLVMGWPESRFQTNPQSERLLGEGWVTGISG